ncbi:aldehyde dehydrogenase family protein, partial [Halobacillus trueperi]
MKIGSIINGEEYLEETRETITVKNPYNEEMVAELALAKEDDLNRAIDISYDTFHQTMKKMPAHDRADILLKASKLLEERKDEFAETITKEAGKPLQFSQGEVQRSVQVLRFAAEEAKHIEGKVIPMDAAIGGENRIGFTK